VKYIYVSEYIILAKYINVNLVVYETLQLFEYEMKRKQN